MLAVPRQLDQRPFASLLGPGDRPGGEQVARRHRGAVHGGVRELLRHRPVEAARVRARDDRAADLDLELDVERPVALGAEVRQRLRVLRRSRYEPVLEECERRHPGADRGRERLAEEGAERLVLPGLDVARAPVVDEHDAEDVVAERPRPARARRARSPTPTTKPSSSSMSSLRLGPKRGASSAGAFDWPQGRRIGVPLTTTVPARPWYPTGRWRQFGNSGSESGRKSRPRFVACSSDE